MRGRVRLPARAAAALAVAAAAAGCGFHLQGATPLSPVLAATYVDSQDRYTEFHRSLDEALRASGAGLARGPGDASAVVEVTQDETGQRVLSVSTRNTPTEYEVFYTVTYRVRAGDRELIAPQTLTLTRDYGFDPTALLAKQQEEELIRAALARDLAALVVRRLEALSP